MKTLALLLVLLAASPTAAQSSSMSRHTSSGTSPVIAGVRDLWERDRGFLTAAADQVPDSLYGFKPTPDVRSFGEVLAHVANSQRLFCGMALGEPPTEGKWTTKADVVAALKSSNDYCARAYAMSDAVAMQPLSEGAQRTWRTLGLGAPRSRLHVLTVNVWHDHEHYGNVATYMRLKGMIPPSSQPTK
jgi:uncharacterized damage-inducible protein DinB